VVEIDRVLIESAGQLVGKHPLRAYDAVQLASALRILPAFVQAKTISLMFVSADDRLIAAAQAEGLSTEHPSQYS